MRSDDRTFVVVSDFHSNKWPLEKVKKYYTKEYDVVYILGDATERGPQNNGEGGIGLLIDIMNLSTGNVVYIPGNHDDFVYSYMLLKSRGKVDDGLVYNICMNGGEKTISDIDYLYDHNRELFNTLFKWLGNLPLQVKHDFDGITYNLAHAFFNEKIYKADPKFNLKKLNEGIFDELDANNILWFRKGEYQYDTNSLPDPRSKVIIGHTPAKLREGVNLDLRNQYGQTIKVICVDNGLTFGNPMLKYVAGKASAEKTIPDEHKYAAPRKSVLNAIRNKLTNKDIEEDTYDDVPRLVEEEHSYMPITLEDLENTVISVLKADKNSLWEFEQEMMYSFYLNGNSYVLDPNINPSGIVSKLFNDPIYQEQILFDVKKELGKIFGEVTRNIFVKVLKCFVVMVGVKYIYESFLPEEEKYDIAGQITGFLEEEDPNYITTNNGARNVARALGAQRIKDFFGITEVLDKDGKFVPATPESYLARVKQDLENPNN